MAKIISKSSDRSSRSVVIVGGVVGYRYWKGHQDALPPGIVSGNGRLEAKLVDVAAKEPLRVKEVLVKEGDLVKPGQVVGRLDTVTLEAELAKDKASVAAAREDGGLPTRRSSGRRARSGSPQIELDRSQTSSEESERQSASYDVRRPHSKRRRPPRAIRRRGADRPATDRGRAGQRGKDREPNRRCDAQSPVIGRVLYRLAEPGEVLGPGGKALTLVNLEDVYMEIFLPAGQAAALKVGAEARITLDYRPNAPPGARQLRVA